MAGERNQDRERDRARAAERLVVPAAWARILDLARERWPALDTRGVKRWPELVERLAEDGVLPEARVEAEVAKFRYSLRPPPLSHFLRERRKRTVYQSGEGHPAQPPTWRPRRQAGQARQNFGRRGRGRWVWGLSGEVGTDDEWDDEDEES